MDALSKCICLLDVVAIPGYVAMTAMVYLSFFVPSLKELASHGKTRLSTTDSVVVDTTSLWYNLMNGDVWMVRKKRFRQFYVVGLLCLSATVWLATTMRPTTAPSVWTCSTILLYLHLMRRFYECTYVHKWNETSVMHVAGYLVGAIHYLWLPMTFIRLPCEACLRDLLGSSTLLEPLYQQYTRPLNVATTTPWVWRLAPILLCLWGQYQQHVHHVILAQMRQPQSDKKRYSLPTDGWFRHVTCPHYLAEVIVYTSFAMLLHQEGAQGSRHFIVAFWVASNLTLSALINYKWYQDNLPPALMQGKKAIVPFLL